jgi:hypothetical protein
MTKQRKKAVNGLVFAVGLVFGLLGYLAHIYPSNIATTLMLGVWIIGGAVVAFIPAGDS